MKLHITISKYHLWYLCQISLQIMLLPIQMYFFVCNSNLDYSTSQLSLAESLEKLGSSSLSKEADTGIGEALDLCKKKFKKNKTKNNR